MKSLSIRLILVVVDFALFIRYCWDPCLLEATRDASMSLSQALRHIVCPTTALVHIIKNINAFATAAAPAVAAPPVIPMIEMDNQEQNLAGWLPMMRKLLT